MQLVKSPSVSKVVVNRNQNEKLKDSNKIKCHVYHQVLDGKKSIIGKVYKQLKCAIEYLSVIPMTQEVSKLRRDVFIIRNQLRTMEAMWRKTFELYVELSKHEQLKSMIKVDKRLVDLYDEIMNRKTYDSY